MSAVLVSWLFMYLYLFLLLLLLISFKFRHKIYPMCLYVYSSMWRLLPVPPLPSRTL